jgi:transposase-like protein
MSQHFLLSAAARTVSLKQILGMEEDEAWTMFCTIRWPETDGAPVCPRCGCPTCWSCPRPNGAPRFRCSACRRDFSPTSGTLFAFHKLEIRDYLAAVVIFCDEVKGKAALALSRDLDVQYKTAFVLAHKIREAMASEVKDLRLGGAGQHVEIDGCYVGGHVRPANRKAERKDLRLAENRSGRRQVVVVIRERALPAWAAPCPPCSPARMPPPASSRQESIAPRRFMPMKPRPGTPCMPGSTQGGSTTRWSTPTTRPAPTRRSLISQDFAGGRWVITIASPVSI